MIAPRKTVMHIAFSTNQNASRLLRAAQAAVECDRAIDVICLGYGEGDAPAEEEPFKNCTSIRIPLVRLSGLPRVLRRSLQWAIWNVDVVRWVLKRSVDVVQSHSLAGMIPGAIIKLRHRDRPHLIYDAHELETERVGWSAPHKAVARMLERRVIKLADHIFVVGELIADWYRETYGKLNLSVLMNVPIKPAQLISRNRILRDDLNISADDLLVLYLGVIADGRGYREIIDAFDGQERKHIVFMGNGGAVAAVQSAASKMPNVHWHAPVPSSEVVNYAAGADVGIALIEDVCLSYRYCLPNKLHEYRLAGLPVIVSDLPEMARYVDQTNSGWKVHAQAGALREFVVSLDKQGIARKVAGIRMPALNWDDEKEKYLIVLRTFFTDRWKARNVAKRRI